MVKASASRSEQSVNNAVSRNWRREAKDAPDATQRARRKCTRERPCLRWIVDDGASTVPEQVLSISDHPLASLTKIVDRWEQSVDGYPPLSERFLAFLDAERGSQGLKALESALRRFGTAYPVLAIIVVESLDHGRSRRNIAEELGLSHPTVEQILAKARQHLRELLSNELAESA